MAVTDSKRTRIVFCEGGGGSADILLLRHLLLTSKPTDAFQLIIEPLRGKSAVGSFVQGYSIATNNPNWIVLRDRDLDREHNHWQLQTFNPDQRERVFLTGLTCIESYFLDPILLIEYLNWRYSVQPPPSELPSSNQVATMLTTTVNVLADYEALRWTLQSLRQSLHEEARKRHVVRTRGGVFDLPNRLTDEDGTIPQQLDVSTLLSQAKLLVDDFRQITESISMDELNQRFLAFQQQFRGLTENEHKLWFHGKDVLHHWLQNADLRLYQIRIESYVEWAAENINLEQFPDLIEFQQKCWYGKFD